MQATTDAWKWSENFVEWRGSMWGSCSLSIFSAWTTKALSLFKAKKEGSILCFERITRLICIGWVVVCLLFIYFRIFRASGRISTRRKFSSIRAEVIFVNGDEAKKLVNEEGYKILDVRDKTQFERAHIKSCYHVPFFIENNDNDVGVKHSIFSLVFLKFFCKSSHVLLHNTYFIFCTSCRNNYKKNSAQQFLGLVLWPSIHKTEPRFH